MSWNWLIAGGDRRALRLAEKLKQNGWQVQTLGLSEGDEQTARPEQADAILLPYPWSARGGLIPTLTGLTLHPENVLRQASPGTLVLAGGGLEDTPAMNEVRRRELRVRRYQDAPGFAERNAAISAEGAVFHAMGETDATLEGLPVMVLGYGLFGRETARRLNALGARVTVLARREEARQTGSVGWDARLSLRSIYRICGGDEAAAEHSTRPAAEPGTAVGAAKGLRAAGTGQHPRRL